MKKIESKLTKKNIELLPSNNPNGWWNYRTNRNVMNNQITYTIDSTRQAITFRGENGLHCRIALAISSDVQEPTIESMSDLELSPEDREKSGMAAYERLLDEAEITACIQEDVVRTV